jgi:uncharacterized RDD family membrane protein YckC
VLGIRVVGKDGTHVGWRRAVVRILALPLSFLLFGLGFAGIVFQRQNRALHDFIAGTAVVYSWDARAARIRFLARTDEDPGQATER